MHLYFHNNIKKKKLESLFKFPIVIDGIEFEDLTFYKGGEMKCCICAHEQFCVLDLSEEELEQFKALGIKYESE